MTSSHHGSKELGCWFAACAALVSRNSLLLKGCPYLSGQAYVLGFVWTGQGSRLSCRRPSPLQLLRSACYLVPARHSLEALGDVAKLSNVRTLREDTGSAIALQASRGSPSYMSGTAGFDALAAFPILERPDCITISTKQHAKGMGGLQRVAAALASSAQH